jgi:formate C-acetyltransferase
VGVPSTLHYIKQGKICEATPDGRKRGEEFSKNTQPVVGMERNGITAMMRSALSAQPWLFSEAYVLDMMLHPSVLAGEDGLKAIKGLVDAYMKSGGISIQFNIFSSKMLRDAQLHPEKYKNLHVRLTGWNVLWNNLSRKHQEAYIKRCEALENS